MNTLNEIATELKDILGSNFSVSSNPTYQELKLAFIDSEPLLTDDQARYFNDLLDQHASMEDVEDDDYEMDYACDGPGWCKECGGYEEDWSEA